MLKITHYHSSRFIEMFGQVDDTQSHYPIKRMVECCSYISDGSHYSPTEDSQGTYPMLSVKDMTDNGFSYSGCKYIGRVDYEKLVANGCKPQKNDVLVAKDGSYFKYAFVVNEDKEQAILSSIAMLRPYSEMVRPRYLAYYMLTDAVVKLVEKNYLTGTAIRRVILKGFKVLPVIVPDLETQDEFIHILEQADKSKFNGFKSRFVEMFGNPLSPDQKYPLKRLGDCIEINPRRGALSLNDSDLVSFVPMPSVSEEGHLQDLSDVEFGKVKKGFTYFKNGDVLFAKITPCMENGKGAIAEGLTNDTGMGSTEFHILRPIEGRSSAFWALALTRLPVFREKAAKNMTGTGGQKRVPSSFLADFPIGLPPIYEQNRFAEIYKQADKSKYLN